METLYIVTCRKRKVYTQCCCIVVAGFSAAAAAAAVAVIIMWKVWKHVRVHHVLGMENTWESLEERFSNQDLCHDQ